MFFQSVSWGHAQWCSQGGAVAVHVDMLAPPSLAPLSWPLELAQFIVFIQLYSVAFHELGLCPIIKIK